MLFHVCLSLALLLWLCTPRRNPYAYLRGLSKAASMAFGTASSAATLSTTIECAVAQGVRRDVAAFVLPLGATINMDGSAIGICISVLYLANASGQLAAMNAFDMCNVGLVSALLSVGAAPVPSSGLITLLLVMDGSGVRMTPLTAYVLAIDWFTDRMRTTVNVLGDAVVCAAVDGLVERSERRAEPPALALGDTSTATPAVEPPPRPLAPTAGSREAGGRARWARDADFPLPEDWKEIPRLLPLPPAPV
mmetsp:Transcript_26932/g.68188  ORF Transcript_26932/g.68188 Transcript_26932/m.68188 type:complete len:250 (-) Transcript_26932:111-860(-)